MNNMSKKKRIGLFALLVLGGIGYRFLWENIPNFEPVTLVCLLAGTYLGREKYLVPFAVMLTTDLYFGISTISIFVYSAFVFTVLMGTGIKNPIDSVKKGFYSSVFFFLWTNFGVWLLFNMYSKDFSGLIQSYVMGLPFYRNTFISSVVLVGFVYSAVYVFEKVYKKEWNPAKALGRVIKL
jgi:hypothetical protein